MSKVEVDTLAPATGTTITIGESGDTVALGSGATASGFGGGKINQVINSTFSTTVFTSSSTFSDLGLSGSITPTSTSSKILVTVHIQGVGKQTNNTAGEFKLLRGSTDIHPINALVGSTGSTAENYTGSVSTTYLDSPSSTSALTYKIQYRSTANSSAVGVNNWWSTSGGSVSTITLIEVLA